MHAAQVQSWSEAPRYLSVAAPPAPTADEIQLRVLAAGAHNVVRSRATGTHYSAKTLPHTPGMDCVARDEATGQLYYITSLGDTFGTFVEYINVPKAGGKGVLVVPLPEGADPVAVAGSVNPAFSSWMAIAARTNDLPQDWTCLILGATSASGRLAVHTAKALGAKRVVGAARSEETLKSVPGLDDYVLFDAAEKDPQLLNAVEADVVLDYVYGDVAERFFANFKTRKPVQYVQIGVLSRRDGIALPSGILRSTDLTIRGAGGGSWSMGQLMKELPVLVPQLVAWPALSTTKVELKDIEKTWEDKSLEGRVVYTI
ncbi:alcohol dehydrogenase protein [Apiospora arundinis]|uniref:Alcohol dehydrogenase protein n=1 Tax=Apiospora arundinis TaxID=335852 RepID=A0ABR2I7I1_9PEZI